MPEFNRSLKLWGPALALILVLVFAIRAARPHFTPEARWNSLNAESVQLYEQENYEAAIPVATKALDIAQANFVPQDPRVAASFENLAKIYRDGGKNAEAQTVYKQLLDLFIKQSQSVKAAMVLGELIRVIEAQGKLEEAMSYHIWRIVLFDQMGDRDGGIESRLAYAAMLRKIKHFDSAYRFEEQADTMRRHR